MGSRRLVLVWQRMKTSCSAVLKCLILSNMGLSCERCPTTLPHTARSRQGQDPCSLGRFGAKEVGAELSS